MKAKVPQCVYDLLYHKYEQYPTYTIAQLLYTCTAVEKIAICSSVEGYDSYAAIEHVLFSNIIWVTEYDPLSIPPELFDFLYMLSLVHPRGVVAATIVHYDKKLLDQILDTVNACNPRYYDAWADLFHAKFADISWEIE